MIFLFRKGFNPEKRRKLEVIRWRAISQALVHTCRTAVYEQVAIVVVMLTIMCMLNC